jgi:hypothetical protein
MTLNLHNPMAMNPNNLNNLNNPDANPHDPNNAIPDKPYNPRRKLKEVISKARTSRHFRLRSFRSQPDSISRSFRGQPHSIFRLRSFQSRAIGVLTSNFLKSCKLRFPTLKYVKSDELRLSTLLLSISRMKSSFWLWTLRGRANDLDPPSPPPRANNSDARCCLQPARKDSAICSRHKKTLLFAAGTKALCSL